MADYEKMTAEELVDANVALKAKINALRDEQATVAEIHRRKYMQELAEQALRNAGVTGVTIAPEPAQHTTTAQDAGGE